MQGPQPFIPLNLALIFAFLPAGLVMILLVGLIAFRRFSNEELMDGGVPECGTPADIDQRVLKNTVEHTLMGLLVWPFIAMSLGAVAIIALGISFGIARLVFWVGYHAFPPMRVFGFAAGYYPTLLGTIWAGWRMLT